MDCSLVRTELSTYEAMLVSFTSVKVKPEAWHDFERATKRAWIEIVDILSPRPV